MKIFSLETKKHLVGWSLGFGFALHIVLFWFSNKRNKKIFGEYGFGWPDYYVDWPLRIHVTDFSDEFAMQKLMGNFIFWILVSLIILSVIRHFRNKQVGKST